MTNFFKNIPKNSIISIIGLAKNVSKTTTLNYLIKKLKSKYRLGLTSIGRDGEKYDVITQLPKPRIFIEKGIYVATAKESFKNSNISMELVKNTKINTPLGEVLILKALESGLIELAGPSINKYLYKICLELKNLGCDLILIDGAFDRRSYATPVISNATILSTGASVSRNMKEVIDLTKHTVKLLTLESETNEEISEIAKNLIENSKVGIINLDNTVEILDVLTSLDIAKEIVEKLDNNSKYVVINGPITDKLLEDLMKTTERYKGLTFLVEDSTKLFLRRNTMEKFLKKGGILKVLYPINIIAITINPTSPNGYEFNKKEFLKLLKENVELPIYDLGANN
ncbi:MAG: hypothetical protein ACFFAQ_09830 [Promethearchaeota archaeon]